MNKGDLVLIPFPFTDLSGQKKRPALILAESESDVTVSFITTQLKWKEEFDPQIEPAKKNGLKRTSIIRLRKLATIDRYLVIGKLGNLTKEELTKVNEGLKQIFKL